MTFCPLCRRMTEPDPMPPTLASLERQGRRWVCGPCKAKWGSEYPPVGMFEPGKQEREVEA